MYHACYFRDIAIKMKKASALLGTRQMDQKCPKPVGFLIAKECSLLQSLILNHSESRASNMSSEVRDYRF